MKKIIDYKIIYEDNAELLEHEVRQHILLGYQPFGSLSTIKTQSQILVFQPMVKYLDNNVNLDLS